MRTSLSDTVSFAIRDRGLLEPAVPVVLMVSGGSDSCALLHLASEGVLGERPIGVLHVNHGLRGVQSDDDERFVVELCARLGVECEVRHVDVAKIAADQRLNLEDAGRQERYRLAFASLDRLCERHGFEPSEGRVLTAHTRDDRVETFFMRAITGAGLGAFGSIQRVRDRIVRVLLDVDREELRSYLSEKGEVWREDPSNLDTTRLRAMVRAKITPAAREWNPTFAESLSASMDAISEESAFLDKLARQASGDVISHRSVGRELSLDVAALARLDIVLARRVLRQAVVDTFPDASRLERFHVDAILGGFERVGFVSDVTGNLRVRREYDKLTILPCDASSEIPEQVTLEVPGQVVFAGGIVSASFSDSIEVSRSRARVVIDGGAVSGALVVRAPREADRMVPFGMSGSKKLSDLLIDEKVPKRSRPYVPVVADDVGIVWVAGVRLDERLRVTDATHRAIVLTWTKSDSEVGVSEEGDD